MPLSEPAEREQLHTRTYEFAGFRRTDGLWDIEGRIVDTKGYTFTNTERGEIQPGEPLHDMQVRLTVDDRFIVRAVEVCTNAGPFGVCPAIAANYWKLEGKRIATGWRKTLKELFAGTEGCTHITELLGAMATPAFQTIYPVLQKEGKIRSIQGSRPPLIDSCHAFRSDGPVVKREWPDHYTGD
jgi:hypothetical protein